MWVKICAKTNAEDVNRAAELGANAVGFVFAKSPRRVNATKVDEITKELRERWSTVERIGVFSFAEIEAISETVKTARLTGVQLHGGYSEHLVEALREEFGGDLRIIQTSYWRVGGQVPSAFAAGLKQLSLAADVDDVLVDSRTAVADGGTGIAFDWEAAREALSSLGKKPLIVAGGLNPGNVTEAIRVLDPWGVDVASGVEASPGVKDEARLRGFIEAARGAKAR